METEDLGLEEFFHMSELSEQDHEEALRNIEAGAGAGAGSKDDLRILK